jgi:predicted HTH domain antitoxin
MSLAIELPDAVMRAIKVPAEEAPARLRRELAVRLYSRGLLTFGKARDLAGMSVWDFHSMLGEEGVERRYDTADLDQDMQTLERLR